MSCKNCEFWAPHIHYVQIGMCKVHGLRFYNENCSDYKELKIEGNEFFWCSICKTDVFVNDIKYHKDHALHLEVYDDPDSYMETYVAD